MTEPQSIEEFEHFHKDGMVRLENEKLKLENMETPGLDPLDLKLKQTLTEILFELSKTKQIDPEQVFQAAISFLPDLDAQRFLIDNLLEAVKRGDNIVETMSRYETLGLLSKGAVSDTTKISTTDLGKELEKRKSLWRRVTTRVIQVSVNAIKSVPKWVQIEPQILLVGPIPAISFRLKGKGMTIQDFVETLCKDTELGDS